MIWYFGLLGPSDGISVVYDNNICYFYVPKDNQHNLPLLFKITNIQNVQLYKDVLMDCYNFELPLERQWELYYNFNFVEDLCTP